ncbi:Rossmann-fold NAD(P)-binding domain-containing protein [Pontixanthobacter aquaemixtae]|nr:SDR family NAD(P)-dependent oxidoreductase [Pontixanthobacter aquaemixtae]
MPHLLIFGLGYTATRIAAALEERGWTVDATGSSGNVSFADREAVLAKLSLATHVLSSVPPSDGTDPVLDAYGDALGQSWLGYLSSTGVYGDTGGAWVDESAPIATGRRTARSACDQRWLEKGARVFRLPGIYGPGRSAFERVRNGNAKRIDLPGQVFSRIHVDDIATGVLAGLDGPAGAYNLSDDLPCAQDLVIAEACRLMGCQPPPLLSLEEADLSEMAKGFYVENRRVANGKAKRVLAWRPQFPTYREGLSSLI